MLTDLLMALTITLSIEILFKLLFKISVADTLVNWYEKTKMFVFLILIILLSKVVLYLNNKVIEKIRDKEE